MCVRDFLAAIATPTTLTTPPHARTPTSSLLDLPLTLWTPGPPTFLLYLLPEIPVSGALWGSTAESDC